VNASTHRIALVAFPCELFKRARGHNESLMREFTFIVESDDPAADVPARLLAVGLEIRDRFFGLNLTLEDQVDAALARGEPSIDLEVVVAAAGRDAAATLGALFDEADAYCRSGDLLTLAEPADVRGFRTWYISEVVRQLDGEAPTSWPDWHARNSPITPR
jgi:hypothetical protein